jgi:hypothetical protein
MNLLNILLIANLFYKGDTSLQPPTKKICKDCKYFIGDQMECKKFSDTNLITGKVSFDYAQSARENNKKCGENAIHFEENHNKIVTVPYYFLKKNSLFIFCFSLYCVYYYLILQK